MPNITGIFDGAAGTAQGKEGTTVQTFAISLAAGFILFTVQFVAFLIIRNYLWAKRIFQPRSFLIPLKDRVKPPPNNPFKWLLTVYKTPEETEVLQKAGMDAYFFLRYLSMCLKIFVPAAILILPILIPINVAGGKAHRTINGISYNVTGLDTMAWSNVSPENTSRYWAHLVLAIGLIGWVCFLFHQELMHYIFRRQEYLGSPSHRLKASSTTVLITDVPNDLCTPESLTDLYDDLPGGLRRMWINRNFESLVNKDKLRKEYEDRLENAETNLIRRAVKCHRKRRETDIAETEHIPTFDEDAPNVNTTRESSRSGSERKDLAMKAACESDLQHDLKTKASWTKYMSPKNRQKMRIPKEGYATAFKVPLIGRIFSLKVDTIYCCRRELARLNKEIEAEVEMPEAYPQNGSVFIQFNTQKAAHLACQAVADIMPQRMVQRTVEISPADINWPALNLTWQNRAIRLVLFLTLFFVVIIVFGILSFFTGILSQASRLADSTPWLRWIASLPRWLLSFIQGTLPPVIQVIVLSGPTPIVLRAMTNSTRGATTGSQGERSLQLWYFVFLLIELFIIPTISTGLTSVVQELIQSPATVPNILATNLPTASNYYFSFLILQAFSISASSILQTIRLFNYYVIGGANTPDRVYNKLSWTNRTRIGSNIPWYTVFAVIGLVYSVIAPLMLVFMLITFGLFYVVIKNNILYVIRTGNVDSGGLWFPSAINQTFTGLYFMEICLIGLFFLVRDTQGNFACEAHGIIMAIAFILTIFYQIWLAVNFNGLFRYAPLRLEGEAAQRDREYEMERLTSQQRDAATPAETATTNGAEKPLQNSLKITDKINTPTSEDAPLPEHSFNPEKRRSSLHSVAIADRSRDLERQQENDKEKARHILARLNRPLDEQRLAELEHQLAAAEARVGNVLIPHRRDVEVRMMNDPISRIIMQHNDELEDLEPEERDMLISVAFTHPVLRETKPSIWIPSDELGLSEDEVKRTRELSGDLAIEHRGAYFNKKLKVEVDKPPPDMSEFALVMAEL